ncbi:MAG: SDR family oxidoreductase [Solirubrobacterales bacterium]|nr:SDR family oxidoreductase [Solirubrobacterales bacterium]
MSTIEGRTALITGASRGLGAAVARSLSELGVNLALGSRSGDDLGIEGALASPCDVREQAQIEALGKAAAERFGGIDIVVANAGVGAYGEFLDLDPEWLEEMIDVNVKGTLYTARALLPHLLRSDAADLAVVASIAGQRGPEGEAVYSASKFAQVGFMRALDHELWGKGVRCSIICPGGIATDFAMGRGRTPEDPDLENFMTAEEVADAVVHAITRPRSVRVLESTVLPMAEDSMG